MVQLRQNFYAILLVYWNEDFRAQERIFSRLPCGWNQKIRDFWAKNSIFASSWPFFFRTWPEGRGTWREFLTFYWIKKKKLKLFSHWSTVTSMAGTSDIEPPSIPRVRKAPKRYESQSSPHIFSTPEELHRKLYFEILDTKITSLKNRFQSETFGFLTKVENLILIKSDHVQEIVSFSLFINTKISILVRGSPSIEVCFLIYASSITLQMLFEKLVTGNFQTDTNIFDSSGVKLYLWKMFLCASSFEGLFTNLSDRSQVGQFI